MKPLITITLAVCTTLCAKSQADFSGSYVMKEKQHINGPEYVNAVATKITIKQAKDSMIFEITATGTDNQESTSKWAVAMNGKPTASISTATNRKLIKTLKWSDDKSKFTLTTDIYKEGNESEIELSRVDEWSRSQDGKELYFHRKSIETVSENWEVKATYAKN